MDVYTAPDVAAVLALHPYVRDASFRVLSIRAQLARQATTLKAAHAAGDRRIHMHLASWWPHAQGLTPDAIMAAAFSEEAAQTTMAREYGFASWQQVEALGEAAPSRAFETALDDMLRGDAAALRRSLQRQPGLATQRSAYGHGATLLHYLGANGVESHRQQTPLNAAVLAKLLIEHGARTDATAAMYGGGQTPLDLARTSAHPYNAGIAEALISVLRS